MKLGGTKKKKVVIKIKADSSRENLEARREWQDIFKVIKGRILEPKTLPSKALIQI